MAGSCHSISFRDAASRHPVVTGVGRLFLARGAADGHEKLIPCHPAVYIYWRFWYLKKLSRYGFIGVPLTSQTHEGSWWVKFCMNGKNEYAVVAQIEYVDVYRLYTKMGQMSRGDFESVREGAINLLK